MIREVVKATGDIITVAGNGTAGYSGDGGPATAAELDGPSGVAFDSAGDLFIADAPNNVVREVIKATGDIITVAGNGTAGYSGDNGPATAAELDYPGRVAVDSAGDVFVTDSNNNVVREFTPAGDRDHQPSRRRPTHFVVTTSFANPDVAGTTGTVTVTAEDPYGNIAGSGPNQYLGTVDLTSTDPQIAGLPPTYTFTPGDDGSHTFTTSSSRPPGPRRSPPPTPSPARSPGPAPRSTSRRAMRSRWRSSSGRPAASPPAAGSPWPSAPWTPTATSIRPSTAP